MSDSIPLPETGRARGRGGRSDAVANRERILAATRRLFAQRGPEAVSMSDIVQAAGVGRGTLYRHFAGKGELCLAVMDQEIAGFQDEVLDQLRRMAAGCAPAMARLDDFLHRLVLFTDMYTPLLREAQRQGLHYFEKKEGTPQYWQRATVAGLLRTAVANGEIPPGMDVEYLADAILAPLNAQLFHQQRERKGFTPEHISANLRAFVARLRI